MNEKCTSCQALAIEDDSQLTVTFEETEDDNVLQYRKKFFNVINRGGLCKPSDAMYMATVHAQEFLDKLFTGDSNYLFKVKNTRAVFVAAFSEKISSSKETDSLSKIKCNEDHPFLKLIEIAATKMFNIAGTNFANDENSKIHEARVEVHIESRCPV